MERAHSFIVIASLLTSLLLFPVSCGENSTSTAQPGVIPLTLTMSDQPPAGLAVLAFEINVTSAVLQPGDISLLSAPTDIEVSRLEVETAFLSTMKAPPGAYSSLAVTFSKPELTILNNTAAPIAGCGIGKVCELKPTLAETTVTYGQSPFPLTISSGSPVGLVLDLDLTKSIQSDLSVTPVVTIAQVSVPPGTDHMQDIDDAKGQVTNVNAGQTQFTLQLAGSTSGSLIVNVDSRTEFEDFDEAGLANAFSSVAVGQVLEVETALLNDGSLLANEVELEDEEDEEGGFLEGVVASLASQTQFTMVVTDKERDVAGLEIGNPLVVTIQDNSQFQIDDEDMSIPSGLTFGSSSDLMPGQRVKIHPVTAIAGSPLSVSTDRLRLDASHLTARVQSISGGNLIVDNLPALFSAVVPSISSMEVYTTHDTEFEKVSGISGLVAGDTFSVAGLLFKATPRPVLVAEKVRKR